MRKTVILILIISIFFINVGFCDNEMFNENLSAILIGDYDSGEILYDYNIDNPIEIASLTKLITYLIAMDMISTGSVDLNDIVKIGKNPTKIGGSTFKLREGEEIKFHILLEAILIASGNDACVAVAEHLAKNEEDFVRIMNQKAQDIGLESAVFINSSGMPKTTKQGKEIQNIMSVEDIFKLSRYIISRYPQILNITNKTEINIPERGYYKENTNPLLTEIPKVDGLKTGYTDKAGYCLISTLEIQKSKSNYQPFRIITITMGAKSMEDRKNYSKEILNYAIENYSRKLIISKDNINSNLYVNNAIDQNVEVYSKENVVKLVKKGDKIKTEIALNQNILAPLEKGQKVGKVYVYNNDKKIDEIDLIVNREVKKASFFTRFFRSIQNLLLKII